MIDGVNISLVFRVLADSFLGLRSTHSNTYSQQRRRRLSSFSDCHFDWCFCSDYLCTTRIIRYRPSRKHGIFLQCSSCNVDG